jgi:hypothetical protein
MFVSGTCDTQIVHMPGVDTMRKTRCRWEDNIKVDLKEVGWWHELD